MEQQEARLAEQAEEAQQRQAQLAEAVAEAMAQGRAESAAEVERLRERLRMGDEEQARRESEHAANEAARAAELEQLRAQRDAAAAEQRRAFLASAHALEGQSASEREEGDLRKRWVWIYCGSSYSDRYLTSLSGHSEVFCRC